MLMNVPHYLARCIHNCIGPWSDRAVDLDTAVEVKLVVHTHARG